MTSLIKQGSIFLLAAGLRQAPLLTASRQGVSTMSPQTGTIWDDRGQRRSTRVVSATACRSMVYRQNPNAANQLREVAGSGSIPSRLTT
jgi:hypothetical protein